MKVVYIEASGLAHAVQALEGDTLMQAAVDNGIPGILGECGGCCSCATCHIFVDEAWADKVPPMQPGERALLSGRQDMKANSRLGCQIHLDSSLDGIVVTLPESQY